ncbi:cupin domain [Actinocorallia herbida]|uniref:Cupin domain n=1 Tax=Actinocorallia herbida TaxID=58109 RepID=A0A3N1DA58_9ACTN|nr:cupin domain-containing protein [Actinocorallia herbida]ROO89988.1 cupin domain [Actinocorallia herbida]
MKIVRSAEARQTSTPTATMTTLASPTLGEAATSVWRVDVAPDAPVGPVHVIDAEQVWTFLSGVATVEVDGRAATLGAGDTIVIPADETRQVRADRATGFTALVTAAAGARAALSGTGEFQTPPWIA